MSSDHSKQDSRMSLKQDLERIEENVDAELTLAGSSHPVDLTAAYTAFDPNDPFASDPADDLRYEVGLSDLREAVLAVERLDDGSA